MKFKQAYQRIFSFIIILCSWQVGCSLGIINTQILPSPINVFETLFQLIINGSIWIDIFTSLWRVSIGFIIAALLGVTFGYLTATNNTLKITLLQL